MLAEKVAETTPEGFDEFPLKDGKRFVVWNYEYRGGKPTKVPKLATTRGVFGASHSDPETWRTWGEALAAYGTGRFDGIGRMFHEDDGIIGVDFDDVMDPESGEIEEDTLRWISILDSYAEVSPSGAGVKVWVHGKLPRTRKKAGIEVYVSHRFFTVTGRRLSLCSPRVETRQEALEALVEWHFPPIKARAPRGSFDGEKTDLTGLLEDANVRIIADMHDGTAETKYGIVCPWVDEHSGGDESGTRVGQYQDGALWFHCDHGHCEGRKWAEFRDKVAPRVPGFSRRPKVYSSGKLVTLND